LKKILAAFAISSIALVGVAGLYIEEKRETFIDYKIEEFKAKFQVDLDFYDRSYDYFKDELVFNGVVLENHKIKKITIKNPRTDPLLLNIDVIGLELPISEAEPLLVKSGFPKKELGLLKYLSKDSEIFIIDGSLKDLLDKRGGVITTEFDFNIHGVGNFESDISIENIPEELLIQSNHENYFAQMNNKRRQKLLKVSFNPSHIKIDTTGLFVGLKKYLTEVTIGSDQKLIEVLDFGIKIADTNDEIPTPLKAHIINGLKALKSGEEFSIQIKIDKTITLDRISKSAEILNNGSSKDIKERLFISLESKSKSIEE
jgi:hypothetical protein